MSQVHKEQEALSMLKSGKFQPAQIARKTGINISWIEAKAQALGLKPLTVASVSQHGS